MNNKDDLIRIVEENEMILRQGGYSVRGEYIALPLDAERYREVEVITPETVKTVVKKARREISSLAEKSEKNVFVKNQDSFAEASSVVMNFANAIYPGGGYRHGARAQEEALCRQSTLYASLSSEKAAEMYIANRSADHPYDTDYMLISPHVTVFRDAALRLLSNPYVTAVVTMPAPNLNGRARFVSQIDIDEVMRRRITNLLSVLMSRGYRSLTLGAWGCGAFGHDARRVARYFYEILFDDGYHRAFDEILFAVLDRSSDCYNFETFRRVLGQ
ncbi:MAG: TIGR02452 family protein [Bacillota bacterium]|nr:TIGR02452 family protein [Bacillota bacterium]